MQKLKDPPKLVLLVEDDKVNQAAAAYLLRQFDFNVHIAVNGKQAVDCTNENSYVLVLMDCNMPEMDGLDATRMIRRREKASGQHVPIVAVTANSNQRDCIEAGMDFFLSKPLSAPAIRKAMEFIVSG